MIASIRGAVRAVSSGRVVVDVGGVGMAVTCTPQLSIGTAVGDVVQLETSLVVREDSLTLYGFDDADQRDVFEAAQLVTGVGPRTALALLATLSPDELRRAVATEDLAAITRVPGIGRKGAQRVVLELKDRLGPAVGDVPTAQADWQEAVRGGLESLGWSRREAEAAVSAVAPLADNSAEPDVGALLRAALRTLDRA